MEKRAYFFFRKRNGVVRYFKAVYSKSFLLMVAVSVSFFMYFISQYFKTAKIHSSEHDKGYKKPAKKPFLKRRWRIKSLKNVIKGIPRAIQASCSRVEFLP